MKLSELKEYRGIDASQEISLYEYGLLVSDKTNKDGQNHIIYAVPESFNGQNYSKFDSAHYSETEVISLFDESWINQNGVLSFCGMTRKDFLHSGIINMLYTLIQYYGNENIFGSSYYPFKIENDL